MDERIVNDLVSTQGVPVVTTVVDREWNSDVPSGCVKRTQLSTNAVVGTPVPVGGIARGAVSGLRSSV